MKVASSFQKISFKIALITILLAFFSLQNFAQLSGTYTIDPAIDDPTNFKTFSTAADALITEGINGPVVFNVADGTYEETFRLNEISGSSAINTITFQSQSQDSSKVKIKYTTSSSNQWVFQLDSTDYITFKQLSFQSLGSDYPRVLNINGTATNITIENCRFTGYNTTSSYDYYALLFSYDDITDNILIQNNVFSNGSFGVRIEGYNSSTLSTGTQILNNEFTDQSQHAIYLEYQDAPIANFNVINMDCNPAYAIYLYYCDNALEVRKNKINMVQGDWGIYLDDCDGIDSERGLISNNLVTIQADGNSNGIYIENSNYINIYHNSVYLTTGATGAYGAFYQTGGSNLNVKNNIFANFGGNYAFNVRTPAAVTSDNNNYFATGNFLAYWNNPVEDLAALKAANLSDANSLSVNPAFLSETDLRTTTFRLEGKGATGTGITTDFEGEARLSPPDIGADEFTGAGAALAGPTYTIGGTLPDFATFSDAVNSLFESGISAPVTFNVRDGSYNEQIEIPPIDGASAINTVTFQSETGDSSKVEISFSSGSDNNYVVKFNGADYITFKKMTISATNTTNSKAVMFAGSSSNDNLLNCVSNADKTSTTYNGAIDSYEANVSNLVIANNSINGGRYGITINSNDDEIISSGIKIINNEISYQGRSSARGIYLRYHDSPEVSDNTINDADSYYYYSIYLQDCTDTLKILRNKVTSNNTYGGILLYNCTGTSLKRGLVANNFVDLGGTADAYGIYTYSSDYQNIFYNSVRITSSSLSLGRAFYNSNSSSNIVLKNNIFSNFGGGYAFYTTATVDIETSSDYNDYYTTGINLAFWDGANRSELPDFQTAATPREAHSISANPSFISSTDLHTTSSFLNDTGIVVAEVTNDIDGEPRDVATPDIGADEFTTVSLPLAADTYTIGGTTPDYPTFTDAADALNTLGIDGPVIFNVRNGTYSEQISLLDINGTDETNTITFQSESGDSSLVELTYSAGASYKYVVELIGTDYITFKNMTFSATGTTYSLVFYFRAGLNNVTISNCVINGVVGSGYEYDKSAIYSGNAVFTDLKIQNNIISGGRSGISLQCDNNNYGTGTRIKNNSLTDQYYEGIFLKYHNAPQVDSNRVDNSTGYNFWGIALNSCPNDLSVQKNIINSDNEEGGIVLGSCLGTTSNRGLVANNFVNIGGTYEAYGIHTTSSNYQRIYNNSVRITSTHTTYGRAFYNYNGSNIDVQNNVFSNFGGGYAYYVNNITAVTTSDYNDLFTTGNNVGYWNGNRTDLAAFQTASSTDANSLSVNPVFVSATDMHATSSYIDSAGTPLTLITDDIDGQARDATYPDIGADEFTPTEFPLAGEYTIGGTTPDYATFTLAVEDLNNLGIDGPVTFNVRSGTYPEQIELLEIAGASVTDSILFQSESGDSSDVTLTYDAQSAGENYLVKLTGTDYITFKSMSLITTDNTYGQIVVLNGSVNNLNILNNIIYTSNSANSSVIYSASGNVTNNILIKQNIIAEGGTGINLNGDDANKSQNVQIIDNIISDQSENGIYLEDQKGSIIFGNEISASEYGYNGIYLNDCDEDIVVEANKISNDDNSTGIYLYYCNGTLVKQGLIANNFISIQGNSYAYGIYMYYCEYQNIYYNSVNIASTYSYTNSKLAFYVSGGEDINVKNNIFANTKGGYAYYINTTAAIESSDFNDLYSTTDIAYWGSAQTNLAALQTASSMDANSVSADPLFASETDLRPAQATLHQAATPVSEVTDDIFGTARDATLPDIGAMEFYCETPTFNVSVPTVCFGDSSIFIDNSTNVAFGSTYSWDWDTDFNPDTTFTASNSIIKHKFETSGSHPVYFMINQIAGCNDWDTIYANVNPSPVLEITIQGAYCDSANGQATVDVTEGNGPFSYYWSTGATDSVATGLDIGTYTVAVSDTNNCSTTETVEVGDAMEVTVTEIKGSTCGISDGEAVVSVTGGVEPYEYVWSNGVQNDTSIALSPGIHYVNIIDANGCYAQGSVNIGNDGTGPQITLVSKTDNDCYGDKLGAINILVSGGSQPYTILWSNGAVTEDIDSLVSGVYDVLITDDDDCVASASYEISQPAMLNISAVVENASCAGSDGQAVAVVSGGTDPYLYSWSSGGGFQIEENLAAGIYSVTVTDANGCQAVKGVIVNNIGGPVVTIESVTGVTCTDTTNGAIDISVSGGTPSYSPLWTPGGMTTQDVSGLSPGTYNVKVTDNVGCIGVNSAVIKQDPPAVNPICMVTVDSITEMNLVVWEKEVTSDVDFYNIYRETSQKNVYQLIGSSPIDSLSEFTDSVADPKIRSWRYKLSVVDKCDNESELSESHKTMHLTQNLGLNGVVNLIWDHYEGFNFSTYEIYRYSSASGWEKLGEIASDLTSYTDLTPPSSGFFYYVVEVLRPTSCTATRKVSTHKSSRSNRTTDLTTGIKAIQGNMSNVGIYPNPSNGVFTLTFDMKKKEDVTVRMFDINGRLVHSIQYKDYFGTFRKTLDLSELGSGLYFFQIVSETGIVYTQIVIE